MIPLPPSSIWPYGHVERFGRLIARRIFTTADGLSTASTASTTGYAGLRYQPDRNIISIRLVLVRGGAGGGGAAATSVNQGSVGRGGAGGGHFEVMVHRGAAPWPSFRMRIGMGGVGGTGTSSGLGGGDTSFVGGGIAFAGHAAAPGGSGTSASSSAVHAAPTSGFITTISDLIGVNGVRTNTAGFAYHAANGARGFSGCGGSSEFGAGGVGRTASGNGNPGSGYGAGGGGALSLSNSSGDKTGGAGTDGVIIVEEYA